jgi:hypothetical protein
MMVLTGADAPIMSRKSRKEYLLAIWGRYQRAGRKYKSRILDEFCEVCGYARKYAIGLLQRKPRARARKPGPKRRYDEAVLAPLKAIWLLSEQMCSKRLKAAVPIWLPFYEQAHGALEASLRQKLLRISPAAMDRLLRAVRARYPRRRLSGTRSGPEALKRRIPLRTDNWDIQQPGFIEADTVAHGGTSMAGEFLWSLTFTDIYSQWTENRAIWNKSAAEVLDRVRELEQTLPFTLRGFDVDNGSEFLTWHLWRYFLERPAPVDLRRSRPYKKNDQAHVEQKNDTHVRQLLGYERLEGAGLIPLAQELYRTWGQLHNFFCPTLKLKSKVREGARTIRKYEKPQTPFQRLQASADLTPEQKAALEARFQELNPLQLKARLEEQLKALFQQAAAGKHHCESTKPKT